MSKKRERMLGTNILFLDLVIIGLADTEEHTRGESEEVVAGEEGIKGEDTLGREEIIGEVRLGTEIGSGIETKGEGSQVERITN